MDLHKFETVVGYDARLMPTGKEGWNDQRGRASLWREDTPRVLSTDFWVWPPFLKGFGLSPEGIIEWQGPELSGDWVGPNLPYWNTLKDISHYLENYSEPLPEKIWILAITCIAEPTVMARCKGGPHLGYAKPATIDPDWTFLGYDVSDGATLSGLTNCGSSRNEAQADWIADLNDNHLFQSIDIADEFRKFIDEQVKEHSPFVICGLYKVRDFPV